MGELKTCRHLPHKNANRANMMSAMASLEAG